MACEYLGEEIVELQSHSIFKDYEKEDWVLKWLELYGGFDGEHHKIWLQDQIARIIHGTEVIVKVATWGEDGFVDIAEYQYSLGEPPLSYHNWVLDMRGNYDEENDEYDYDYSVGIAP